MGEVGEVNEEADEREEADPNEEETDKGSDFINVAEAVGEDSLFVLRNEGVAVVD